MKGLFLFFALTIITCYKVDAQTGYDFPANRVKTFNFPVIDSVGIEGGIPITISQYNSMRFDNIASYSEGSAYMILRKQLGSTHDLFLLEIRHSEEAIHYLVIMKDYRMVSYQLTAYADWVEYLYVTLSKIEEGMLFITTREYDYFSGTESVKKETYAVKSSGFIKLD